MSYDVSKLGSAGGSQVIVPSKVPASVSVSVKVTVSPLMDVRGFVEVEEYVVVEVV